MTKSERYELVEVDMAAGPDDLVEVLVAEGTLAQMVKALANSMRNAQDDFDTYGEDWPTYRVQPAA